MKNTLRIMTPDDLAQVFAIEQVSHPSPWPMKGLQESLQNHVAYVLEQDGAVIGFAFVQRILDEAHLLDIALAPSHRGKGLGRELLRQLMDEVLVSGVTIWFLEVRVSNVTAISLYQSLGYNELSLRRNYYDGPEGKEDALLMACSTGMG
ncbi:ribosomal protein S18-alanine N-acetyltransferase [Perlucidibaca aquatica]|jgi:ribosomal-protein-alanine N-acetyltransferase|uniref:ribosomal protein S18-alanine N-acetyltransferase n=1 Tax=Perlucidibaca aquatica TaxID=1852776 RepID=UPI00083AC422|nr:ribosomal protein S18-alanine N-acetyltransferase [Perlucidibaca aquatica]